MKLSEAILLGSTMIKGRRRGAYPSANEYPIKEGCALDMAAVAVGEQIRGYKELEKHWPWMAADYHAAHNAISNAYDNCGGLEAAVQVAKQIQPVEPSEAELEEPTAITWQNELALGSGEIFEPQEEEA